VTHEQFTPKTECGFVSRHPRSLAGNFSLFFSWEEIRYTLRSELSWSHYRCLMRVENKTARIWYADEAATQGWSVRALDRQISTLYYERLLGSSKQDGVRAEAAEKIAAEAPPDPRDFIRAP